MIKPFSSISSAISKWLAPFLVVLYILKNNNNNNKKKKKKNNNNNNNKTNDNNNNNNNLHLSRVALSAVRTIIKEGPKVQIELKFRSVRFCRGRKTLGTRREPTTNSTHMRRRVLESNPGHRGGSGASAYPLRQQRPPN